MYLPSLTIVPFKMIGDVEANSRPQKICLPYRRLSTRYSTATHITHDHIAELEGLMLGRGIHLRHREGRKDTGTYGEQGLYKLAHDSTEDEAYEDREHYWTMAPEPYPSVFPLEKVTNRMAGTLEIPTHSSTSKIK